MKRDPSRILTDANLSEKEYNRWYLLGNGMGIIAAPFIIIALNYLLRLLAHSYVQGFSERYVIPIDETFYWLPALFGGLGLTLVTTKMILLVLLKEKYDVFDRYAVVKARWDPATPARLEKILYIVCLLLTLSLCYLFLRTNIRFGDDSIMIEDALKRYPEQKRYSQVTSIHQSIKKDQEAKSSDITFAIDFSDGEKWATNIYHEDTLPATLIPALEFVSMKSGVKFEKTTTIK